MDVLIESPIEALAFGYISYYDVVNNIWTWIAFITTAALSFWRIKAAGAASICSVDGPPLLYRTSDEDDQVVVQTASTSSPVNCRVSELEMDVVTKGKLTVYYNDDEGDINNEGKLTVREWGCGKSTNDATVPVSGGDLWERLLRIRSGETSWYRNQDLTMINGNVVRLWENERYSYSSSFVVW